MVEPKKLRDFCADAVGLSATAFREKYGELFLVLTGSTRRHAGMLMTMGGRAGDEVQTDIARFDVWGLHGPVGAEVTIGRARNNDIVVSDSSISSFHAAFTRLATGWALYDGESRNGTKVDGKSAPSRAEGEPLPIGAGQAVVIGSVDFLIADSSVLISLASKIAKKT